MPMKVFADDEMAALLAGARPYTVALLRPGPRFGEDASPSVIWEHGRRNLGLRHDGSLAIVLPIADGSQVCGVCVFNASVEDTTEVMKADPAVAADVLTFEVHPCAGFPGDSLP
jgi:hypothetical protein